MYFIGKQGVFMDIDKVAEETDGHISEVDKRIEQIKEDVEKTFEKLDKDISNVMEETNETKIKDIIEKLKTQAKSEKVDLSIIQGSQRLPDEDFAVYKEHLRMEKKMLKKFSRGSVVHNSLFDGQRVGHFKKD